MLGVAWVLALGLEGKVLELWGRGLHRLLNDNFNGAGISPFGAFPDNLYLPLSRLNQPYSYLFSMDLGTDLLPQGLAD